MTVVPDKLSELYELAGTQCEGELTAAQIARIEELLLGDGDLRRLYILYMHVHARAEKGEPQTDVGLGMGGTPPIIIHPSPAAQPSVFSLNAPLGGMLFSYAVSALFVCLGMLIGWTWKVAEPVQLVRKDSPVHTATALFPPKMAIVGRITGMVECKFSEDKDILPPPGNNAHVPLGRKYKLDSGLMEISYDAGAKVILQGPVTFEVESAYGGFLSIGRLTARVEERGEGRGEREDKNANMHSSISDHHSPSPLSSLPSPLFFVRTPTAVVTDLGTEFGVDVDRSGLTASHVFRGKVVVAALADGDEKPGREVVLGENESARVEKQSGGGGPKIVVRRGEAKPGDFVRSEEFVAKAKEARALPLKPFHRWKAFSEELRRRDDLLAYYDFQHDPNDRRDATNSEVLRNRAATGRQFDGQLRGAVQWAQGRFPGKHALRSGYSDDDGVHINIPVECKQITLAAWVNVETISRPICSLLSSDSFEVPGKLHWLIYQDGRMSIGFFGFTKGVGGFSLPAFDKSGLGKWCFVAAVFDPMGGKFTNYLNGKLLNETPIEANSGTVKLGPAMIGAWEPLNIPCPRDRRIEGRMDELMIFRSALSPEEIRKIYEGTRE